MADLGTDPAVFVHPGMPSTLFAAYPTGVGASLDHLPEDSLVAAGAARRDRSRRCAEVGAVQIEANAEDQIGDRLLAEVGVGARRTGLGAVVAGVDALNQDVAYAAQLRMAGNHFAGMHACPPLE